MSVTVNLMQHQQIFIVIEKFFKCNRLSFVSKVGTRNNVNLYIVLSSFSQFLEMVFGFII